MRKDKKVNMCNILDDGGYQFYCYCKRHGWTDGASYDNFDELSFFEGDPDIIKYDGQEGFFFYDENNNTCYYWIEVYGKEVQEVEEILRAYITEDRECFNYWDEDTEQTWDYFDKHKNVIAWRGGRGYVYSICGYNNGLKLMDSEHVEKRKAELITA